MPVDLIRLIGSDGTILWEKRAAALPSQQERIKLTQETENKSIKFESMGPIDENGQIVWTFKQKV